MKRRNLIVGGGAAAVATTLTAVTGAGMPAQAAVISTLDHAQRFLDEVNVDRGLVDPAGLQRQFEQSYADGVASPPRDPYANDLYAWVRQRMMEIGRTDSFAVAVTEIPQTRSLLAFVFLAYSQNQGMTLPRLDPGSQVPSLLRDLEPDFLPVLLDLVTQRSNSSREFASALLATTAEMDRFVAEKVRESSGGLAGGGVSGGASGGVGAQSKPGSGAEGLEFTAGILVILATVYSIKRKIKD